ncbi:DNA fragmentation factor subunit beta isoform X1 [Erpetoichthys calabaricus]|uniref:DNA fragmentation factor subunit beta n=1 Tax=Erpetoichthys calabaricus TaxID=27687 RepID=A0A8C4X602_ERPCA|nr:DNA fragmentation factor subunit beta isoform X1 [Erpetoichthys calabaricus]
MGEKIKLFKIRRHHDRQKYGIAAHSTKELLKKCRVTFQVPLDGCRVCLYEDGTEVTEDYFQRLPNNTELVLLPKGQSWHGYVSDIECLLGMSDEHSRSLIEAAQNLLVAEKAPKRRRLLQDFIANLSENTDAECREEDEAWFEGIDSRFKTKSAYLKYSCESRIRGYQKEVEDSVSKLNTQKLQTEYRKVVDVMINQLKQAKYNGCYFDRQEKECNHLCTQEGWFSCQGAFDTDKCLSLHSINPYGNRESRILFSTWNLDHRIEKKRAIIPALIEAVKNRNGREVNCNYFYRLLFTIDNLKLVHIACHKKTVHNLTCDAKRVYVRIKRKEKKQSTKK